MDMSISRSSMLAGGMRIPWACVYGRRIWGDERSYNHTMHTALAFFDLVRASREEGMGCLAGMCIHRGFNASLLHTFLVLE
jgi:hypothetical protein